MQSRPEQLSAFMCLCCGERLPYPKDEQEALHQQRYGCGAILGYRDQQFYEEIGLSD